MYIILEYFIAIFEFHSFMTFFHNCSLHILMTYRQTFLGDILDLVGESPAVAGPGHKVLTVVGDHVVGSEGLNPLAVQDAHHSLNS